MFLKQRRSLIFFLSLLIASLSFAEESHVDFSLSPSHLEAGNIQVAFEWLSPHEFRKRNMRVVDLVKVQHLKPHNNHLIASKTAILSKKPMSHFSLSPLYNGHSLATLRKLRERKVGHRFFKRMAVFDAIK